MCMVPPMVSAATGALLVPHAAAGQARLAFLLCCYALFGLSLGVSAIATTLTFSRMALRKIGPAHVVAGTAVGAPNSTGLKAFGIVFGVPV